MALGIRWLQPAFWRADASVHALLNDSTTKIRSGFPLASRTVFAGQAVDVIGQCKGKCDQKLKNEPGDQQRQHEGEFYKIQVGGF